MGYGLVIMILFLFFFSLVFLQVGIFYTYTYIKKIIQNSEGVILEDKPFENHYPMPLNSQGKDDVYVGRVRRDNSCENSLNMWVVCDNLRKGAATNTIQIMQLLTEKGFVD